MSQPAGSAELDGHDSRANPSGEGSGADLVLAGAIAVAAPIAAIYHPGNVALRTALSIPALLLVPGYLLLQTILPSLSQRPGLGHQAALSVGFSLPVVGLAALSASVTPWGFRPTPVILSVMVASLALCAVAAYRRSQTTPASEEPDDHVDHVVEGSS